MTSERVRLAVIGAGLGSAPHFRSLEDLACEVDVAWIYGRNAQRLAAAVTPASATKTTRLGDILDDASVQAVLVLTPPNTHLDMVERRKRTGLRDEKGPGQKTHVFAAIRV